MGKNLLIVESPSKAKTISKYLDDAYIVKASVGHIRDLPKSNKDAIDIEHGFTPHYEIVPEKEKVVSELKSAVNKADEVFLATDPDREGEAIAYHLSEACDLKRPKRVVFHEITKEAVIDALSHPRVIDKDLVKAQEARRVLDRIVGYDLSGLIWKKLRYGLSAGRVQSPALRILVEREREIRAFVPEAYWEIKALMETKKKEQILFDCSVVPKTKQDAEKIVSLTKDASWRVGDVESIEQKRNPRPPFITSTLQQAASSRLGYSPAYTMRLAQKLYEAGHITYMRTDSTHIAQVALGEIGKEIQARFGKEYANPTTYQTKSKNAQEAHEAIRPTHAHIDSAGNDEREIKLYRLIWTRAIASQMASAQLKKTKITASTNNRDVPDYLAHGSQVTFDGWLRADTASRGEDVELPAVLKDDHLNLVSVDSLEKETEPPHRYTEAGLVKELEKRGIGRPSTYATIVQTLKARKYVEKLDRSLKPTETGEIVSEFLEKHFANIVSDSFTAEMEEDLDRISRGEKKYEETLKEFYTPFAKLVGEKQDIPKITTLGDAPADLVCPTCQGSMVIKLGKAGRFYSCAKFPECRGIRTIDGKLPEEKEKPKSTGVKCPACTLGELVERKSRFGIFYGCSKFPTCRHIAKKLDDVIQKHE